MRLYEFANAEEQINLWKLISDSVWKGIKQQAIEQEKKRLATQKNTPKTAKNQKTKKKTKSVAAPKAKSPSKKHQASTKPAMQQNQQPDQPQTQKPQVLPKVFTNTARSSIDAPQTPATSASSLSAQNATAPQSVAQAQRQLYPLASNEVVKRLAR